MNKEKMNSESGVSTLEYLLIAALIAVAIITAGQLVKTDLNTKFAEAPAPAVSAPASLPATKWAPVLAPAEQSPSVDAHGQGDIDSYDTVVQ